MRKVVFKGVNGIGHIDVLLRIYTANDVIGLQETKTNGYRAYFSGDCSGVRWRKGQHGVGLAVKEEFVKKAGKDGIAIECISARLLKVRISIKSTFVTFAVAYAPTEDAMRGRRPSTW